jgi:ornithine cyclodeaminase/alanine dehydrogenase-like protein (mu-crystallin family)
MPEHATGAPTIISEAASAALVDEALALEAARAAFLATAEGTSFPVVIGHTGDQRGRVTLKSGAAGDLVGVKIGSFWPGNDAIGLTRHGSTIVLLDPGTGRLAAVVEAATANAYRTAAADALAISALARPDARTLAVFGTGNQALYEVRAAAEVRPIHRILVIGRRSVAADELARKITAATGIAAESVDARTALREADIVVTATTAREPLFDAEHVRPGTHISAMGADSGGKQELPTGLYDNAALFCDLPEQSRTIGEFQHVPGADLTPLGAVLSEQAPGRRSPEEITIFDSSGFALQDLTLAAALLDRYTQR